MLALLCFIQQFFFFLHRVTQGKISKSPFLIDEIAEEVPEGIDSSFSVFIYLNLYINILNIKFPMFHTRCSFLVRQPLHFFKCNYFSCISSTPIYILFIIHFYI